MRVQPSDFAFSISPDAFAYLAIQQGKINDLANDRPTWDAAYHASIFETYRSIAPHLPESCPRILDVGSGLGGIDALLNRHYGGSVEICPIDGEDDQPVMNKHDQTFNSEKVTRAFLNANGVRRVSYFPANALPQPSPFKLIVSFASWCFHYPPGRYLHFVKRCLHPSGRLIVDVRRDKPEWAAIMRKEFRAVGRAHRGLKFDRMVYAA